MFQITVETSFTARHYLRLPNGTPETEHPHTWRVEATVAAPALDSCGLVIDFHLLERLLREVVAPLTAAESLNQHPAFFQHNPSAERVAEFIYRSLQPLLSQQVALSAVVVWEQGACRAIYSE